MERLLTVPEVAAILGVSRPTLYRYIGNREIPFVKLPNGVRFRPEDVAAFVSSRLVKPVGGRHG